MEYWEGNDLLEYILYKTRLSEQESQKIFPQLINTLFNLHSQKISLRDIKIDNLVRQEQKFKIGRFRFEYEILRWDIP